jgi:mannose-6-phosphate isomerase-like protein (cupin superfamily)
LSQALDVSIDRVLAAEDDDPFLPKSTKADTPVLLSQDGKVHLAIIGWLKTVEWLQVYDVCAESGGCLESEPHQRGSIEQLTVIEGTFEVEVSGEIQTVHVGETSRYRCDRPHSVRCVSETSGRAMMVCILKAAVMD